MSDTKNVKLGVCKVFFDGVDMGYTQGGVEFSVNTSTHKVEVDQFGKTVINETVIGRECKIKTPFAETTIENLAALFPSFLATEGTLSKRKGVDTAVGVSLLETAKMMVLHPIAKKDYDYSDEVVIPFANTPGQLNFSYALEKERIFDTEFMGYPDPVSGALFYVGSIFTDEVGKTLSFTNTAASAVVTVTGATAALTGKMVMLGATDGTSVLGAPLLPRKLYYVKFVTATTVSLHATRDDAIAGNNAISITGASTGSGLKLTILN
jgi:hypothetical protein